MYNLKIRLCGKNIESSVIYESTVKYCEDYATDFDTADLSFIISPMDIDAEKKKFDRERELEGLAPTQPNMEELERLALYRKIAVGMIDYNIILFHGSAIAVDGEAYLFTAKSGTGKSTHTKLWRRLFGERAVMVNDDKPLIEITDGGAIIHGTPWNGKHRLSTNISSPLKAICILERAKENNILKVEPRSEFAKILSQTYRNSDPEFMKKTLMLIDRLLGNVSLYKLGCNMDPEAAIVSYNGMKG